MNTLKEDALKKWKKETAMLFGDAKENAKQKQLIIEIAALSIERASLETVVNIFENFAHIYRTRIRGIDRELELLRATPVQSPPPELFMPKEILHEEMHGK